MVVENRGKHPARKVMLEERNLPPELKLAGDAPVLEVLEPGARAEVSLALTCSTRGAYELPWLQASSFFPSALVKWPRRAPGKDRLLVYPRFTPLERFDVPHGRNYQPGGIPIASSVGESTELAGTREWREGDRLRDIHWPSLARTGRLVVKEYQEEYFVRLAMVLDVETREQQDEALFERSLSLAAGIADVLARQEYIIDIFAAGSQVFHFRAGRALAHFEHILEILACLETEDRLDVDALEAVLLPGGPAALGRHSGDDGLGRAPGGADPQAEGARRRGAGAVRAPGSPARGARARTRWWSCHEPGPLSPPARRAAWSCCRCSPRWPCTRWPTIAGCCACPPPCCCSGRCCSASSPGTRRGCC